MPDNYDIIMSLGKAYAAIGNLDQAIKSIQRATKLTPAPSVAFCELASATQLQGDLEQALGYIEQSLEHQPDNIYARVERASILNKMGRTEQAHELLHELVDEGHALPHLVSVWPHLCHHYNECSEVISLCESLASNNDPNTANTAKIHYTLGRLYDRADEYHSASLSTTISGDFN